jgi:hypothetical protein
VSARHEPGDFVMTGPAEARDRPDVHAIVATAELAIRQIASQPEYARFVRCAREAEPES